MRKWRVGTVSMGMSLVLLGILLLSTSFMEGDTTSYVLAWWPAILIILGIEVIVYLFMVKQEKPVVHYDFVSILFIGLLGTVGIGLYGLTAVGLMDEVKGSIHSESVEKPLPKLEQEIPDDINRIVVQAEHQDLDVETNDTDRLYLFGSYTASVLDKQKLKQENVVQVTEAGGTLYVQMLRGINHGEMYKNRTISLPSNINVEIRKASQLNLSINSLETDWTIDRASNVRLNLAEGIDTNIKVERENPEQKDIEETYGEGTHTIEFHEVNDFLIE